MGHARLEPDIDDLLASQSFDPAHPILLGAEKKIRQRAHEWLKNSKTDADGLPSAGVVLVHDADEQFVWPALRLGESHDLIHVFHTGSRQEITAAA